MSIGNIKIKEYKTSSWKQTRTVSQANVTFKKPYENTQILVAWMSNKLLGSLLSITCLVKAWPKITDVNAREFPQLTN